MEHRQALKRRPWRWFVVGSSGMNRAAERHRPLPGTLRSRQACSGPVCLFEPIVTNCIDGLANPWVEGVLGILHQFAQHGAADPAVADWTGRWWTYWGAFDLVPMGCKVFVTIPVLMQPFTDASVLEIASPTQGRISRANGFDSHGEPARRILAEDGTRPRSC